MISLSLFSGFALALLAGLLYAFLFLPVAYLKLCDDSAHSCTGGFSYYSAFVTSLLRLVL